MRIARAVSEFKLPWPSVGNDELERWLVREAVMEHYHTERQAQLEAAQAREKALGEASETGKDLLATYLREREEA